MRDSEVPIEKVLAGIASSDVREGYATHGLGQLSDVQLVEAVASLIARPKVAKANSFVLHAPLELLARAALLPMVAGASREAARYRLVQLGATYLAAGDEVSGPPQRRFATPEEAAATLTGALAAGELHDADGAAAYLAAALTPSEVTRLLAREVLPRLSAAGHASIFFYQLRRGAPRSALVAMTLRPLARELARGPAQRLTWQERRPEASPRAGDLVEVLRQVRATGEQGSNGIYPTIDRVERSGLAAELLDAPTRALPLRDATQRILRVSAWSMLQDNPAEAPYGWSHCLTIPQAVLGIADVLDDPAPAVAIAATYVLGFRASFGGVAVDPTWSPTRPSDAARARLDGPPLEAAAALWYAAPETLSERTTALATRAALHDDAHLAKYTVACFDAARADPEAARVYLAAAAYLSAWWGEHDRTP